MDHIQRENQLGLILREHRDGQIGLHGCEAETCSHLVGTEGGGVRDRI